MEHKAEGPPPTGLTHRQGQCLGGPDTLELVGSEGGFYVGVEDGGKAVVGVLADGVAGGTPLGATAPVRLVGVSGATNPVDDFLPLGRWGLPNADDVASGGLGGLVGAPLDAGISPLPEGSRLPILQLKTHC